MSTRKVDSSGWYSPKFQRDWDRFAKDKKRKAEAEDHFWAKLREVISFPAARDVEMARQPTLAEISELRGYLDVFRPSWRER